MEDSERNDVDAGTDFVKTEDGQPDTKQPGRKTRYSTEIARARKNSSIGNEKHSGFTSDSHFSKEQQTEPGHSVPEMFNKSPTHSVSPDPPSPPAKPVHSGTKQNCCPAATGPPDEKSDRESNLLHEEYESSGDTYTSSTVPKEMIQSSFRAVNAVREHFGVRRFFPDMPSGPYVSDSEHSNLTPKPSDAPHLDRRKSGSPITTEAVAPQKPEVAKRAQIKIGNLRTGLGQPPIGTPEVGLAGSVLDGSSNGSPPIELKEHHQDHQHPPTTLALPTQTTLGFNAQLILHKPRTAPALGLSILPSSMENDKALDHELHVPWAVRVSAAEELVYRTSLFKVSISSTDYTEWYNFNKTQTSLQRIDIATVYPNGTPKMGADEIRALLLNAGAPVRDAISKILEHIRNRYGLQTTPTLAFLELHLGIDDAGIIFVKGVLFRCAGQ